MMAAYPWRRQVGATRFSLLMGILAIIVLAGALNHFLGSGKDAGQPAALQPPPPAARVTVPGSPPGFTRPPASEIAIQADLWGPPEPIRPLPAPAPEPASPIPAVNDTGDKPWLPQPGVDPRSIGGQVLDQDGQPVEGVRVVLEARRFFDLAAPYPNPANPPQVTTTDYQGVYTVAYLRPGLYRVRAEPPPEYRGTDIIVGTGVENANLVVQRTGAFWVYGVVTNHNGRPLRDVKVAQIEYPTQEAFTDYQGKYALALLLSNRTRSTGLLFHSEDYGERRIMMGDSLWTKQSSAKIDIKF